MDAQGPYPLVLHVEADARRLQELEKAVEKLGKRSSGWDRFKDLLPLLQAVILAWFGWWFTNRVDQRLKERELALKHAEQASELEFKHAAEMQPLLKTLHEKSDASAAMALTAFGEPAAAPLLGSFLAEGVRAQSADALRALALVAPARVCEGLGRVLVGLPGSLDTKTLLDTARLLGRIGCPPAAPITSLSSALEKGGLAELERRVSDPKSVNNEKLNELKGLLKAAAEAPVQGGAR